MTAGKRLRIAIAVMAAVVAAAALSGCTQPTAQAQSGGVTTSTNVVTAQGDGEVTVAPDRARLSFTVSAQRKTAKETLAQASAGARRVTAAIRKTGVPKDSLQTSDVNMYPERDSKGRIKGYRASISLKVDIEKIDEIGRVLEAATVAGATDFWGPSFYLSKDNAANDKAIEAAVADARRRASVMAKAAGGDLGDVLSVGEPAIESRPFASAEMYRATAMGADAGVPIEPGQVEARAQLTVTFQLR